MQNHYSVEIGNIGTVYDGANLRAAKRAFREYKNQSVTGYGRASGENVTLMANGNPLREYYSPHASMRADLEEGECAVIADSGRVSFCGQFVAQIGSDCTRTQALRELREAMQCAGFWPNCYETNCHGNVACVSTRTGKAYKGMQWV